LLEDSEKQKIEQIQREPVLTCVDPDDVTIDILMYHYVREEGWDPVS
jgi:hypothetical protein